MRYILNERHCEASRFESNESKSVCEVRALDTRIGSVLLKDVVTHPLKVPLAAFDV